ncbi:MAG TPA: complex I NDUFA9 subunit family protein [Pelomicrobium sp.]|nr:complex I NDUFA9 subunit family protein [Pelomicrobium sp.]
MKLESVCILGGSGFVGRHIVHLLARESVRVRIPTRHRESVKEELILLPTVDVLDANVHDDAELDRLVAGRDAVINLVGILHAGKAATFERVHTELPRRVVEACQRNGVRRYVHMSALNASPDGPSEYLRTKGEAEKLVKASGLDWTIFRPSVIFGRGDSFLNMFASTLKLAPFLPLACPDARFQPVWVEDVAAAFTRCLTDAHTFGQAYDLCGPKVYTLRELVQYVGRVIGKERPVIGLNDRLSYLQARMMEFSPIKVMTRDNYYSMKIDSVCHGDFPAVFGFEPTALEAVAPEYLGGQTPRSRYKEFRDRAGR